MVCPYIHEIYPELINDIRYETSRPLALMDLTLMVTIRAPSHAACYTTGQNFAALLNRLGMTLCNQIVRGISFT